MVCSVLNFWLFEKDGWAKFLREELNLLYVCPSPLKNIILHHRPWFEQERFRVGLTTVVKSLHVWLYPHFDVAGLYQHSEHYFVLCSRFFRVFWLCLFQIRTYCLGEEVKGSPVPVQVVSAPTPSPPGPATILPAPQQIMESESSQQRGGDINKVSFSGLSEPCAVGSIVEVVVSIFSLNAIPNQGWCHGVLWHRYIP